MKRYRNLSGNSGISAFDTGADYIKVQFDDGSIYLYDYTISGIDTVEKMKMLARSGFGLCTYINTHVRDRYAAKLR